MAGASDDGLPEAPMAASEVVSQALPALAGRDPQRFLAPAAASGLASRLNLLEVGSMGCVVLVVAAFYLFCLVMFGFRQMISSGTPIFGGYVLALVVGLAVLRGPLDRLLAPIHRLLAQIPPLLRIAAGVGLPLLYVLVDSKDMGSGFTHAGFTVTVATMIGHVLFSSLRCPRR